MLTWLPGSKQMKIAVCSAVEIALQIEIALDGTGSGPDGEYEQLVGA